MQLSNLWIQPTITLPRCWSHFTFSKLNISNHRLDLQTLVQHFLCPKTRFTKVTLFTGKHLCKKKAAHSIKIFVRNTVSIVRGGTVTVPPQHTQIHNRTTVNSRLPLNYNTRFYSKNKQIKAILGIYVLYFNLLLMRNISGGQSLCQMVWLLSAVIMVHSISQCCYFPL